MAKPREAKPCWACGVASWHILADCIRMLKAQLAQSQARVADLQVDNVKVRGQLTDALDQRDIALDQTNAAIGDTHYWERKAREAEWRAEGPWEMLEPKVLAGILVGAEIRVGVYDERVIIGVDAAEVLADILVAALSAARGGK